MPATMQTRVLEVAAEIAGGIPQLCERLGATQPELEKWLRDDEVCPLPLYLKAVDIILESEHGFKAIFSKKPPGDGPAG